MLKLDQVQPTPLKYNQQDSLKYSFYRYIRTYDSTNKQYVFRNKDVEDEISKWCSGSALSYLISSTGHCDDGFIGFDSVKNKKSDDTSRKIPRIFFRVTGKDDNGRSEDYVRAQISIEHINGQENFFSPNIYICLYNFMIGEKLTFEKLFSMKSSYYDSLIENDFLHPFLMADKAIKLYHKDPKLEGDINSIINLISVYEKDDINKIIEAVISDKVSFESVLNTNNINRLMDVNELIKASIKLDKERDGTKRSANNPTS